MVDDGVGIVLDGASEVVLVADLDGLADGVFNPGRHWRPRVSIMGEFGPLGFVFSDRSIDFGSVLGQGGESS